MADEAKQHSQAHQKWIRNKVTFFSILLFNHDFFLVNLLKSEESGAVSYGAIVEEGENHQCDTVGAMLKILKNRRLITYKPVFLMFPMHKDEIVTLGDREEVEQYLEELG